ncbi:hypothetical protein MWH25_09075 [Natroniella acetigena]|uniref:hypothetical protein n=1 Tax=Natroniella acetigena TaxID=52004 RepID=UPI00200AB4DF|nr:hypothetical protein [Natroniella acetigena]MCK8827889.1 hypothetical protein [Natroniella acetigena]
MLSTIEGIAMGQLYSHPDKLLKDHLCNVYQLGIEKFATKDLNFTNLAEVELLTKQGKNKSNYSLNSALFTYYLLTELIEDDFLSY